MITFPHKILNPLVNFDLHNGVFFQPPPVIPIPGKAMHLGASCFYLAIPPDRKNNECKLYADNLEVVSQKHSVKYSVIPHWNMLPFTPPQYNLLMPVLILGSESKCEFAVVTVQAKDGPVAVSIFQYVGLNLACADPVMMPTSVVVNWGSVHIGFGWADLFLSLVAMGVDIGLDCLWKYLGGKIADRIPKGWLKGPMLRILRWANLPKIFRDAEGRFASMGLKLGNELVSQVAEDLLGRAWDATAGDPVDNFVVSLSEKLI